MEVGELLKYYFSTPLLADQLTAWSERVSWNLVFVMQRQLVK